MEEPVYMPRRGREDEPCLILAWHKREGEAVSAGEVFCEAEVNKAVISLEAAHQGVLKKILVASGQEAFPGEEIALFERSGGPAEGVLANAPRPEGDSGVRPNPPQAVDEEAFGPVTEVPLRGIRKTIAARMSASLSRTAQLTNKTSADASELFSFQKHLAESPSDPDWPEISVNSLLLYLVSRVLPDHPGLNGHFVSASKGDSSEEAARYFKKIHLGFAVDTPRGLLVPVIRNARELSLAQLAGEARRLAAACRENRISPEELSGSTFTVTNLSSLGMESFTPIINPPELAILGIGSAPLRPVDIEGKIVFRPCMGLMLTYDHRFIDGAPAARFLWDLRAAIENISSFFPRPE